MKSEHIKQMMLDTLSEYEQRIGYTIDKESRLQHYVQDRVALANVLRPYATYKGIGEILGKDHSSVVHYVKEHEPMMKFYPSYVAKYKDALEIANRVADRMSLLPKFKYRGDEGLVQELKTIKNTIKNLRQLKKKIELSLGVNEEVA